MFSKRTLCCWMCGQSCCLEDCKTDEHGLPVHEDCYVSRVTKSVSQDSFVPARRRPVREFLRGHAVRYVD